MSYINPNSSVFSYFDSVNAKKYDNIETYATYADLPVLPDKVVSDRLCYTTDTQTFYKWNPVTLVYDSIIVGNGGIVDSITGGNQITVSGTADIPIISFNPKKYNNIFYVDPVNGVDATTSGSYEVPFKTISYSQTQISGGSSSALMLTNGAYSENVVWTTTNCDIIPIDGAPSSSVYLSGTWTFSHTTGSVRCRYLAFYNTLVHDNAGFLYLEGCLGNGGSITSSGAGYFSCNNCDFSSSTGTLLTGAKTTSFFNSQIYGLTINNSSANVNIQSCLSLIGNTSLIAGNLLIRNTVLYALSEILPVLTTSSGSSVGLLSTTCFTPTNQPARISLSVTSGYSIQNTTYDKTNSILGINLDQKSHFDGLFIDGTLSSLPSATSALVRDPTTGEVKSAPLALALNDLTDVNTANVQVTDTIGWNGAAWVPQTIISTMDITSSFLLHCNLDSIVGGIIDSSTYALTGVNYGTTLTTGKINNAIAFTSNGQYVDFGPQTHVDFSINDEFSCGLWMQTLSSDTSTRVLISQGNGVNNNGWALLYQSNINEFTFKFMESATAHSLEVAWRMDANVLINDGLFHFISASKKTGRFGSSCTLFIDGVDMITYKNIKTESILVGEDIQTLGTANLMIGDASAGWSTLNNHVIDEIFITNFAMIESQALDIFTQANGIYTAIKTVIAHTHSQTQVRGLVDRLNAIETTRMTAISNTDGNLTINATNPLIPSVNVSTAMKREIGTMCPIVYTTDNTFTLTNGAYFSVNNATLSSITQIRLGWYPPNRTTSDYEVFWEQLEMIQRNGSIKIKVMNITNTTQYITFALTGSGGSTNDYHLFNATYIAGETNYGASFFPNGSIIFLMFDITGKYYTDEVAGNLTTLINGKVDSAINQGTGEAGLYINKTGTALNFKTIQSGYLTKVSATGTEAIIEIKEAANVKINGFIYGANVGSYSIGLNGYGSMVLTCPGVTAYDTLTIMQNTVAKKTILQNRAPYYKSFYVIRLSGTSWATSTLDQLLFGFVIRKFVDFSDQNITAASYTYLLTQSPSTGGGLLTMYGAFATPSSVYFYGTPSNNTTVGTRGGTNTTDVNTHQNDLLCFYFDDVNFRFCADWYLYNNFTTPYSTAYIGIPGPAFDYNYLLSNEYYPAFNLRQKGIGFNIDFLTQTELDGIGFTAHNTDSRCYFEN